MDYKKYNKEAVKKSPEFVRGVALAAGVAQDLQGTSKYRLEDRILCKLNLISKRQLRNALPSDNRQRPGEKTPQICSLHVCDYCQTPILNPDRCAECKNHDRFIGRKLRPLP